LGATAAASSPQAMQASMIGINLRRCTMSPNGTNRTTPMPKPICVKVGIELAALAEI